MTKREKHLWRVLKKVPKDEEIGDPHERDWYIDKILEGLKDGGFFITHNEDVIE